MIISDAHCYGDKAPIDLVPMDIVEMQLQRERKKVPKKTFNYIDERIGALKLYMDFIIEWKMAKATGTKYFSWHWGKFVYSAVYANKPEMPFDEFHHLLRIAYSVY